jgi:hypothetical protein
LADKPLTGGWGVRAEFYISAPTLYPKFFFKKRTQPMPSENKTMTPEELDLADETLEEALGTLDEDFDDESPDTPDPTEYKKVGRPRKRSEDPMDMIGELSIFDETEPRSMINIVPDLVSAAMKRLNATKRHLFIIDERALKKRLKPDAITSRLRLSFWDEYTRAQDMQKTMLVSNIVKGACSLDYFYKRILTDDRRLAWIVSPPKDYALAMRELLDLGIDEWRDILAMPNQDRKGRVDHRLIAQKIKIVQMLDLRVKGAIVQKLQVQNKNLNMNVNATAEGLGPILIPENLSIEELIDLEARLDRIKSKGEKVLLTEAPGAGEFSNMGRITGREYTSTEATEYADVVEVEALEKTRE